MKLFDEGVLSHFSATTSHLTVSLFNSSESTTHVALFQWDFGDGQSSAEENPVHTYAVEADYVVRLTVTDLSGDVDFFERTVSASN